MKNLQTLEEFLNESYGWDPKVLTNEFGGYDDSAFLKIAWYLSISELEDLLKTSKDDLSFLKKNSKGTLSAFNRRDTKWVNNRIDYINQIIKSKKSKPDFVPDSHKK